jgi:2-polyprenyl-3-methyl-5-hydroxy-6-metoxy-1,4-benzoquinol methylase
VQSPQFHAHARLEDEHWWFTARRQIFLSIARRVCPPGPAVHIIDVGCGTGANTAAFAREYQAKGIDPSSEAIAFARDRFPAIPFDVGDALDRQEEISTADVVLLLDVLEHVEDDVHFVTRLLSLMRPGAHLLIAAPHDLSLWGPHDRAFEHYRRYSIDRLRRTWEGQPVTERLVTCFNSRLYFLAKLIRFFTRLTDASIGEGNTDVALPSCPINQLFRSIFAGEGKRILSSIDTNNIPYRYGVSVLALLRREEGSVVMRTMPVDIHDETPWRD